MDVNVNDIAVAMKDMDLATLHNTYGAREDWFTAVIDGIDYSGRAQELYDQIGRNKDDSE